MSLKLGIRSKKAFLHRKYTNGQSTHERMLNSVSQQGNAHQTTGNCLFISTRSARKSQTIESVAKDVRKYTAGRDMKW